MARSTDSGSSRAVKPPLSNCRRPLLVCAVRTRLLDTSDMDSGSGGSAMKPGVLSCIYRNWRWKVCVRVHHKKKTKV